MMNIFENWKLFSTALGSKKTPCAENKKKVPPPASLVDLKSPMSPTVPDVALDIPLEKPQREGQSGNGEDAEIQRGLISSNQEFLETVAYESAMYGLQNDMHLFKGFQLPTADSYHPPPRQSEQQQKIDVGKPMRATSSPINIPKRRMCMRQPMWIEDQLQHPSPSEFQQSHPFVQSSSNKNVGTSSLYPSQQCGGPPVKMPWLNFDSSPITEEEEDDQLSFLPRPDTTPKVVFNFRHQRNEKDEAKFQLCMKTFESLQHQIQLTKSTFTQQLDEVKAMLRKAISVNSETSDRILNLEKVIGEQKSELEASSKLEVSRSEAFGRLSTRFASLEEFQTRMKEDERLKCHELGSLQLRIASIQEMEGRLDAPDGLPPEQTATLILELKSRVGTLEELKGSFGAWDLEDLSTTIEQLATSVSGVKVTLEDFHARIQNLESGKET